MAGIDNDVFYGKNSDYTGVAPVQESNGLFTDGQLWIGSTAANAGGNHIKVGTLTAGSGVTITPGSGTIQIAVTGGAAVNSITAGSNINLTGTAANPIVNLNTRILEPANTAAAPAYSFSTQTDAGMYLDGTGSAISWGGSSIVRFGFTSAFINQAEFSGFTWSYVRPGAYPYTVTDDIIFVSVDTSLARTINVPNSPRTNKVYVIKDGTGSAASNNITITTPGGVVTFDGGTTFKIDTNYGSIQLLFNGTSYEIF